MPSSHAGAWPDLLFADISSTLAPSRATYSSRSRLMPLSLSGVAHGSSILLMQTTTGIPAVQQLTVLLLAFYPQTKHDVPRSSTIPIHSAVCNCTCNPPISAVSMLCCHTRTNRVGGLPLHQSPPLALPYLLWRRHNCAYGRTLPGLKSPLK
jgi:hypothetical protein